MNIKAFASLACVLGLGACASTAPVPRSETVPIAQLWQDPVFKYDPSLVTIGKRELFALDADLLVALKSERLERATAQNRVIRLMALLYGPRDGRKVKEFPYESGHSSIAADTWRRKRGDCLSLLVLAYSIAKTMELPVTMQEVRVPPIFDRYGGVDYVAGHVNLLIKNGTRMQSAGPGIGIGIGDVIIDFEPQFGSKQEGSGLSEDAILARFYNNLAAEFMADGDAVRAYAYFKAAILTDGSFAPSYANLALLYKRSGLPLSAERMLRYAINLNDDDDVVLSALHRLLVAQGRDSEAEAYARVLESRREKNPYYWIGLGIDQYNRENYRQAINALEHAEALSTGFEEVHRYLALAYLRNGNQDDAKKQAMMLASLTHDDPAKGSMNKKIKKLQSPQ